MATKHAPRGRAGGGVAPANNTIELIDTDDDVVPPSIQPPPQSRGVGDGKPHPINTKFLRQSSTLSSLSISPRMMSPRSLKSNGGGNEDLTLKLENNNCNEETEDYINKLRGLLKEARQELKVGG